MNIQYNPTPLDILKLLGCADSDGRALLEDFEAPDVFYCRYLGNG